MPLSQTELRNLVFEALFHKLMEEPPEPIGYVGLQADRVVVMQAGGEHFSILILPAHAEVPA